MQKIDYVASETITASAMSFMKIKMNVKKVKIF